jgi:hypothetical protein
MVQNKLEMHQHRKSLLKILKTMLDKHKHSFSIIDFSVLEEKYIDLSFYHSIISKTNIPKQLFNFLELTQDDSLYYLSTLLDKYCVEENALQKLVIQFEQLKKHIELEK